MRQPGSKRQPGSHSWLENQSKAKMTTQDLIDSLRALSRWVDGCALETDPEPDNALATCFAAERMIYERDFLLELMRRMLAMEPSQHIAKSMRRAIELCERPE